MAKRTKRTYSPELKAQVIAEWRTGDSPNAIQARHKVPRGTIRAWVAGLVRQVALINEQDDWDNLGQEWLRESIKSLIAVLKHSQDPAWLQRQSAHDLAIFYGVNFDKSSRLVGAASNLIREPVAALTAGAGDDSGGLE